VRRRLPGWSNSRGGVAEARRFVGYVGSCLAWPGDPGTAWASPAVTGCLLAVQRMDALGPKSSSPPGAMNRGLAKQSETRRYIGERIARGRAARMAAVSKPT